LKYSKNNGNWAPLEDTHTHTHTHTHDMEVLMSFNKTRQTYLIINNENVYFIKDVTLRRTQNNNVNVSTTENGI